jgi:hypothetical protein
MPQKKETTRTTEKKTGGKVQDLAPKKDAKGGGRNGGRPEPSPRGFKVPS